MKKLDPEKGLHADRGLADLCQEFCLTWTAGSSDAIEEFLANQPASLDRAAVLARLLQCEIELRRRAGQSPLIEEYAGRFSELDQAVLQDLILLPSPPPPSADIPTLPARYRPIKEIGRGGIGSVWRVEDTNMNRTLAAKILLPPYQNIPACNVRLDRESLLTGSLVHPGVPPIHDRGELASGSSFFTMKLVDGKTLARILSSPGSAKERRARLLGIFEQIAQTVSYAHSEGIIHRDLKPQNVMVGRFGEVQIMDWGMARKLNDEGPTGTQTTRPDVQSAGPIDPLIDETTTNSLDSSLSDPSRSLTRQGDVIGTPAYMSPEQARGELDLVNQRSDVFSLGAILFEILTGSRLYDDIPDEQVLESVRNGVLESSLTQLEDTVQDSELVQLCKSCLKTDPCDRPSDAQDIANAMDEYTLAVDHRLRQAELDTTRAQVQVLEERKRWRLTLVLASAIILVGSVGLAGVIWQWKNATASEKLARMETQRAASNFDSLMTAVDRMLTRVGDESLDQIPHMKGVRRELLQDALEFYQKILVQTDDSPAIVLEVAAAHQRVGKIQYLLGEYQLSIDHDRKAVDLLQTLAGESIDADLETPMASSLESIARNEKRLGNLEQSEGAYLEAIKLRSKLMDDFNGESERVIHLADSLRAVGSVQKNLGDLEGAEDVLNQATTLLEEVVSDRPDNTEAWLALAACFHGSAAICSRRGEPGKALAFDQQAVDVLTPLLETGRRTEEEVRSELSNYLNNLATTARKLGDFGLAESCHQQAIELRSRLIQEFPSTPEYRNLLASSYINLGVVYKQDNREAESGPLYEKAISILERLSNDFPEVPKYQSSLGITLHNLANLLEVRERNQQAVDYRKQAITVFQQLRDDYPETTLYQHVLAIAKNDLAIQMERRGQSLLAIEAIHSSIAIRRQLIERFPENRPYRKLLATSCGLGAWILAMAPDVNQRNPELALTMANESVEIDPDEPSNQRALGAALLRSGRFDEALKHLHNAVQEDSHQSTVEYMLAIVLMKMGEQTPARQWFQKAEEIAELDAERPDINLAPIREEAAVLFDEAD